MYYWRYATFVLIVTSIQRGESKLATQDDGEAPIEDYFTKDWIINGSDSLVYSRIFNRHREFGYVNCNKYSKICNVNVVRAVHGEEYRTQSCGMRYDLISGETGDIALYLPDDDDVDSTHVVQAWWLKDNEGLNDTRITALNLRNCMNAGFRITPVAGDPSRSRVIAYRYPSFDLVYNDVFNREERAHLVTFRNDKNHERSWSLNVSDQRYMYEEKGMEFDSSRGFFYLSTNGEPDWTVRVMYANSSAKALRTLGVIDRFKDPTRTYPKTSGARRKYGLCWKSLDRRDNRVNCTQFNVDGQRSVNEISLTLPETIDWLALHNLKGSDMLIVTGKCDGGKCRQFSVRKINASGQQRVVAKIDHLNAECPTAPYDLSMDVVDIDEKNWICFNFVCLSALYKESSAEKLNTILRYRRHCIDKDFVEKVV